VALKVVSMQELKLQLLSEPERTGDSVAEVCRRRGISRESFYAYRRRYEQEGIAGLAPRSRRPRSYPGQIAAVLGLEICALRRQKPRWEARRIRAELHRAGMGAAGGLDHPSGPAPERARSAGQTQAAEGRQALRARRLERALADRLDRA
jgi:transposase-like protein